MMRGFFGSSWWLQGGGKAIITLWAADRDRGRWLAIIPVLSFCRRRIVGGDLPPSLSFRPTGGGLWAVSGCRNDVARLAYFSQRSGQTYPDRICWSSGCDVCECRVPFPEEVWIGEVRHMSSWGVRMEFDSDVNACHVFPLRGSLDRVDSDVKRISFWGVRMEFDPDSNVWHVSYLRESGWSLIQISKRDTSHQGEGSLQCPPFNLPILPGQNGRVKNDCFWNWGLLFSLIGPRGARGRRVRKEFMLSRWLMPNWCLSWFVFSWCSLIEEVINKIYTYNTIH